MAKTNIPVVQTVGLTKAFKDFWRRARVKAVTDLDLEIRPGEVFGLLGPNGSGKSTTIKIILGLLYPTRGRVAIFGRPPTDVAVKKRIGFLPEESYLYQFLDARETLDFYGRLFQQHGKVRGERLNMLLDMVGLQHEAKRRVGEYSKGMSRRIGLAQALINDPEFLILDEPTSGLDPIGTRQIKDVIRRLGDMGKTILLSSHLLADVEDVCDRVCILYGGKKRAEGTIDELLARDDRTQITTDRLDEDTVAAVRDVIERRGIHDIDVSVPRGRLEQLFLDIVREAQEAKVATSGVGATGAIPEFLGAATSDSDAIIRSLIEAGGVEAPPAPVELPAPQPVEPSATSQIIEELLTTKETHDAVPESAPPNAESKPASEAEPPPMRKVEADQSVIDDLLGGSK
ncbi:MAG: ATP-binding cassette domain-containing protein [Phycisphaerales bacterium]|nr:ATP-binding cassette domain-containing protein [Phycisphaerales bacterium]